MPPYDEEFFVGNDEQSANILAPDEKQVLFMQTIHWSLLVLVKICVGITTGVGSNAHLTPLTCLTRRHDNSTTQHSTNCTSWHSDGASSWTRQDTHGTPVSITVERPWVAQPEHTRFTEKSLRHTLVSKQQVNPMPIRNQRHCGNRNL